MTKFLVWIWLILTNTYKNEEDISVIPEQVLQFANERKIARENKDFQKADLLRKKIEESGYQIKDIAGGDYKIVKL